MEMTLKGWILVLLVALTSGSGNLAGPAKDPDGGQGALPLPPPPPRAVRFRQPLKPTAQEVLRGFTEKYWLDGWAVFGTEFDVENVVRYRISPEKSLTSADTFKDAAEYAAAVDSYADSNYKDYEVQGFALYCGRVGRFHIHHCSVVIKAIRPLPTEDDAFMTEVPEPIYLQVDAISDFGHPVPGKNVIKTREVLFEHADAPTKPIFKPGLHAWWKGNPEPVDQVHFVLPNIGTYDPGISEYFPFGVTDGWIPPKKKLELSDVLDYLDSDAGKETAATYVLYLEDCQTFASKLVHLYTGKSIARLDPAPLFVKDETGYEYPDVDETLTKDTALSKLEEDLDDLAEIMSRL